MWPDCSPPSRLPAPRISRSFIATYMPAPSSVCWAMVASRSCAVLGERLLPRVEEVRVRPLAAAADPAADLVQLGQAEQVGPLDDQRVGVRDVDAGLDDGRADQDVELLLPEADHHLLQRVLAHLPVRDRDPRLGHQLAQPARRLVDRLDPVVQVEDLAVAQQLAVDGRGHLLVVVRADEGQHRVPLLRRGGDGGHLPDAGDRHLQRARDRRGRHGQHVDRGAQRLELLLVLDAEALLLVDDDQAEVLEPGRSWPAAGGCR